jgi:hypothetical protein
MIKLAITKAIPAPKKHHRLMLSASMALIALFTSLADASSSLALWKKMFLRGKNQLISFSLCVFNISYLVEPKDRENRIVKV